ncbi:hypothetical protein MMC30_001515 [Trapelia coarctata]|nr:hypothetical protein [Trapelia coarctata]
MQDQHSLSQQRREELDSVPAAAAEERSPTPSPRAKVTRGKHSEFAIYIRERTEMRRQKKQAEEKQKREEEMRKREERTRSELSAEKAGWEKGSNGTKAAEKEGNAESKETQASKNGPSGMKRFEYVEEEMLERSIDGVVSVGGDGEWKRVQLFKWRKIEGQGDGWM